MFKSALLLVAILCCSACLADKITSLPGYEGPTLPNMYSGYIEVNKTIGANMFYWHIEAEVNPSTAPLVFWFQGGPGCSGLLGLLSEHGPLRPNDKGGLSYTNLAWTQHANMVWLEAPVGVGFSYVNKGYHPTDNNTAINNYAFLQAFIEEFPQYKGRATWITGESYGGVYVPTLAYQILSNPSTQLYKQFTGSMLGNGVFRCQGDVENRNIDFNLLYWHGLVSYSNYDAWLTNFCAVADNTQCSDIFKRTIKELGKIDQELVASNIQPSLDPDCLYQDFCTGNGTLQFIEESNWPSCQKDTVGGLATTYLNRPDVQTAIHAKPTTWSVCANVGYESQGYSLVPYYEAFPKLKPSFKVLVYSGDIDILTVPFAETQPCLAQLKRTPKSRWAPWYVNGATAGYVEYFDTYTYATIKGAGHEAPEYQPLASLNLFGRFLKNQNLTDVDAEPVREMNRRPVTQGKIVRELLKKHLDV